MMNFNSLDNKIIGIMYHYVRELKTSEYKKINFLKLKEFKRQISFLKKKFNIIGIEDILFISQRKFCFTNAPFWSSQRATEVYNTYDFNHLIKTIWKLTINRCFNVI